MIQLIKTVAEQKMKLKPIIISIKVVGNKKH